MIFVKYDKTQIELLFAQSQHFQIICSVYVDTPRVSLLVTVFFITIVNMVIIELYKPRAIVRPVKKDWAVLNKDTPMDISI